MKEVTERREGIPHRRSGPAPVRARGKEGLKHSSTVAREETAALHKEGRMAQRRGFQGRTARAARSPSGKRWCVLHVRACGCAGAWSHSFVAPHLPANQCVFFSGLGLDLHRRCLRLAKLLHFLPLSQSPLISLSTAACRCGVKMSSWTSWHGPKLRCSTCHHCCNQQIVLDGLSQVGVPSCCS